MVALSLGFSVAPFAKAAGLTRPGVPNDASAASTPIRRAIQIALASGKRRVRIDTLLPALDERQRTYDDDAARQVFQAIISACITGDVNVVVGGVKMAARVRNWLDSAKDDDIKSRVSSIGLLGTKEETKLELEAEQTKTVFVIMNPESGVRGMVDLRKFLKEAHTRGKTVIIQNHARELEVCEQLGYGGPAPIEMEEYEDVFFIAPFGIERGNGGNEQSSRFVLMRQFPGDWGLWKFVRDERQESGNDVSVEHGAYVLCQEYEYCPEDNELLSHVGEAMRAVSMEEEEGNEYRKC